MRSTIYFAASVTSWYFIGIMDACSLMTNNYNTGVKMSGSYFTMMESRDFEVMVHRNQSHEKITKEVTVSVQKMNEILHILVPIKDMKSTLKKIKAWVKRASHSAQFLFHRSDNSINSMQSLNHSYSTAQLHSKAVNFSSIDEAIIDNSTQTLQKATSLSTSYTDIQSNKHEEWRNHEEIKERRTKKIEIKNEIENERNREQSGQENIKQNSDQPVHISVTHSTPYSSQTPVEWGGMAITSLEREMISDIRHRIQQYLNHSITISSSSGSLSSSLFSSSLSPRDASPAHQSRLSTSQSLPTNTTHDISNNLSQPSNITDNISKTRTDTQTHSIVENTTKSSVLQTSDGVLLSSWLLTCSDIDILRFIRSKKYKVEEIWKAIKLHAIWRVSAHGADTVMKENEFLTSPMNREVFWLGVNQQNCPTLVIRTQVHDGIYYNEDPVIFTKFMVWILEQGREKYGVGREKEVCVIIDRTAVSGLPPKEEKFDRKIITRLIELFRMLYSTILDNYPDILSHANMLPVSWFFKMCSSITLRFMDSHDRSKFHMISSREVSRTMLTLFLPHQIPSHLGGTGKDENYEPIWS